MQSDRTYYFEIDGLQLLMISNSPPPCIGETIVAKVLTLPPWREYVAQEIVRNPVQRAVYVICAKRRTPIQATERMAVLMQRIEKHDAQGT